MLLKIIFMGGLYLSPEVSNKHFSLSALDLSGKILIINFHEMFDVAVVLVDFDRHNVIL